MEERERERKNGRAERGVMAEERLRCCLDLEEGVHTFMTSKK